MIEKTAIIITSLGRTGTRFFYTLFDEILANSNAFHQPDVIRSWKRHGIKTLFDQMQEVGAYHLLILKAIGQWSLIKISDARVVGKINYTQAAYQALKQRQKFVLSQQGSVYVESSVGYYGLVDVLKDVYEHHRVVYIIRDGRDWVRSQMNWGGLYDKGRVRSLLAHTWPTAVAFEDDPYRSKWREMSRFEKLCWAWAKLNGYALTTIEKNPNARLFYFEDIFKSADRYRHLGDLVEFTTPFPGVELLPAAALDGWLERRVHQSRAQFPAWPEWPVEYKRQFETICGPLMTSLGYRLD